MALSQLKAYILLQITHMVKFLGNTNDTGMVRFNVNNYAWLVLIILIVISAIIDSDTIYTRNAYKEWMQTASGRLQQIDKSREIVKCDPNGFIKGNKEIVIATMLFLQIR